MFLLFKKRSRRVVMCSILHLRHVQDGCQSACRQFALDGAEYFATIRTAVTCGSDDSCRLLDSFPFVYASTRGGKASYRHSCARVCRDDVDGNEERALSVRTLASL